MLRTSFWGQSWVVLVLGCVLSLVGCKRGSQGKKSGKLYVVTTTGMLADAAKRIGGEKVRVEGLMGPSVDPHLYKATAADTRKLAEAGLVLYNGLHLEGKMQEILTKMGRSKPVVAATDKIDRKLLRKPAGYKGAYDPHVWFDVSLWEQVVKRVGEALVKVDPKNKATYEANAKAYVKELVELHKWVKKELATIPEGRRVLVTSHDAFGYFGQAYGLKVVGLQGISTVSEAGLKDIERVINLIVTKKLPAIFAETSVSDNAVKAVMERCARRKHKVSMGGKLFSDAMGPEGTPEGTYVGMVRFNVNTVKKALSASQSAAQK